MNKISIRGTAELIATLPYQLGYHPQDSVLVVCLHDGQGGMIARLDLPPADADVAALVAIDDGVDDLMRVVRREGPDAVLVLAFESEWDAAASTVLGLVSRLEQESITVIDRVCVHQGRWRSLGVPGQGGDSVGLPVPAPCEVEAVAELVAMGRYPLADRGALDDLVAYRRSAHSDAMQRCLDRRLVRARANPGRVLPTVPQLAAWRRLLTVDPLAGGSTHLRPSDTAAVVFSLIDRQWRDGVIAWMAPGTLGMERLDDQVAELVRGLPAPATRLLGPQGQAEEQACVRHRWLLMCQSLPDRMGVLTVATLTVTGQLMWCTGDGALARACLERALRIDPDYYLARLLLRIVANGIRLNAA